MVRNPSSLAAVWPLRFALIAILGALLWCFPLFHIVPFASSSVMAPTPLPAVAEKFWTLQLSSVSATDASTVATALQKSAPAAIKAYAHTVGLGGTAYFFLHGEGRIVSRTRDAVQVALGDAADAPMVELQIGAIFGNTVRDATGLLDVNQFPSLQDFNALAAELNQFVESRVLPALRADAKVGVRVSFTGCAEAIDAGPSGPVLSIVPIQAEVHP